MEANQVLMHSSCKETRRNHFWVLLGAVLDSDIFSAIDGNAWISVHSNVSNDNVSDNWDCTWELKGASEYITAYV